MCPSYNFYNLSLTHLLTTFTATMRPPYNWYNIRGNLHFSPNALMLSKSSSLAVQQKVYILLGCCCTLLLVEVITNGWPYNFYNRTLTDLLNNFHSHTPMHPSYNFYNRTPIDLNIFCGHNATLQLLQLSVFMIWNCTLTHLIIFHSHNAPLLQLSQSNVNSLLNNNNFYSHTLTHPSYDFYNQDSITPSTPINH